MTISPFSSVQVVVFGCAGPALEQWTAALRDLGIAVTARLAHDPDALARLAAAPGCDMAWLGVAAEPRFEAAVRALRHAAPDLPLLVLVDTPSEFRALAAEAGASDVVSPGDATWLAHVVRRERENRRQGHELHQTRTRLAEAEARCNGLVSTARDAIAYVHQGVHVDANRSYLELFGLTESDIEGLPVMDLLAAGEHRRFRDLLRQVEVQRSTREIGVQCLKRGGEGFFLPLECSPATVDGEPCVQLVIREAQRLEERLLRLTTRDALTGLLNRVTFAERLELALEHRDESRPQANLILVGITNFAVYQATTGLPRADELLRQVALTLTATAGSEVKVARFSDHQFALLCPPEHDAGELARRCLDMLPTSPVVGCVPVYNAGIAAPREPVAVGANDWLLRAVRALQKAEALGPNATATFRAPPPGDVLDKLTPSVLELLDDALANERLYLRYQPIVSLRGDAREHYTVMVRVLNRNETEVFPDDFLEQAARTDRVAEIDRWVVRSSIRELARQRSLGRKAVFFLSLSPAAVDSESILLWVCDCLREFQANGAWLVFQFREAELARPTESARRLIDGLRKINCRIAVSHYTGEGPFSEQLPRLPVDAVKLAPEFMADLTRNPARQERLREARRLLEALGIKTIATAVEEPQSLGVLWHAGIDYVQGFLLQRPTRSIEGVADRAITRA